MHSNTLLFIYISTNIFIYPKTINTKEFLIDLQTFLREILFTATCLTKGQYLHQANPLLLPTSILTYWKIQITFNSVYFLINARGICSE